MNLSNFVIIVPFLIFFILTTVIHLNSFHHNDQFRSKPFIIMKSIKEEEGSGMFLCGK